MYVSTGGTGFNWESTREKGVFPQTYTAISCPPISSVCKQPPLSVSLSLSLSLYLDHSLALSFLSLSFLSLSLSHCLSLSLSVLLSLSLLLLFWLLFSLSSLMRYMKKDKRQTIFSSWSSRLLLAKSTCIWVNLPAVFQLRLASGTIAPFL